MVKNGSALGPRRANKDNGPNCCQKPPALCLSFFVSGSRAKAPRELHAAHSMIRARLDRRKLPSPIPSDVHPMILTSILSLPSTTR